MLAGGPAVSLLLSVGLWLLKTGGFSLRSEVIAPGAAESLLRFALSVNGFTLVLSLLPARYFLGETRGLESDGLQILRALRSRRGGS